MFVTTNGVEDAAAGLVIGTTVTAADALAASKFKLTFGRAAVAGRVAVVKPAGMVATLLSGVEPELIRGPPILAEEDRYASVKTTAVVGVFLSAM